jgi:TPP-dependent trihydroxycyclohexane-1,2-dione (THcHDO) dehydratase
MSTTRLTAAQALVRYLAAQQPQHQVGMPGRR